MQIPTARLLLRPLTHQDVQGYGRLLTHPRVHPFVVEEGPVSGPDIGPRIAKKLEQWANRTGATWAVLCDSEFVGYVALHGIDKGNAAMSYAISPDHQRRGYGLEAVVAVLMRSSELGVVQVEARTHLENDPSIRLLLASGFTEIEPTAQPPRRVFRWPSA